MAGAGGEHGGDAEEARRRAARRRARLDGIFGTALPEAGPDETGRARAREGGDADDWLRRNVPPHHG